MSPEAGVNHRLTLEQQGESSPHLVDGSEDCPHYASARSRRMTVGLLLTALLQPMEGLSVRLYEKRREYTRTRMVQLAPYLVADSVESYRSDSIDGDSVEAVFDPAELEQGLAFRRAIPADLAALFTDGRWGSAGSTPSSAPSAI